MIIAYLDAQDYIKIFNEKDVDGPYRLTLKKILEARDRGEVVFGFSYVTIVEFITKPDKENTAERVRRGELVKEICGSNAFPYVTELVKGAVFPNDGNWMPLNIKDLVSGVKVRNTVRSNLKKEIMSSDKINRAQRRALAKKSSLKNMIVNFAKTAEFDPSDYKGLPVPDRIKKNRLIERFLAGECSDEEFESYIKGWFSDPAEFSRIAYEYGDMPNMIEKIMGNTHEKISNFVERQNYI